MNQVFPVYNNQYQSLEKSLFEAATLNDKEKIFDNLQNILGLKDHSMVLRLTTKDRVPQTKQQDKQLIFKRIIKMIDEVHQVDSDWLFILEGQKVPPKQVIPPPIEKENPLIQNMKQKNDELSQKIQELEFNIRDLQIQKQQFQLEKQQLQQKYEELEKQNKYFFNQIDDLNQQLTKLKQQQNSQSQTPSFTPYSQNLQSPNKPLMNQLDQQIDNNFSNVNSQNKNQYQFQQPIKQQQESYQAPIKQVTFQIQQSQPLNNDPNQNYLNRGFVNNQAKQEKQYPQQQQQQQQQQTKPQTSDPDAPEPTYQIPKFNRNLYSQQNLNQNPNNNGFQFNFSSNQQKDINKPTSPVSNFQHTVPQNQIIQQNPKSNTNLMQNTAFTSYQGFNQNIDYNTPGNYTSQPRTTPIFNIKSNMK